MSQPRRLSAEVKRAIYFSNPVCWLAPLFFLIGSLVCVPFFIDSDLAGPFVFSKHDPRTEGRLTAKVRTGSSINEERIVEYVYAYQVGSARLEGRSFAPDNGAAPDSPVTVQYVASHPATSRLEGMRRAPFGWIAVLVAGAFPAAGLLMQFFVLKGYRERRALVQHGVLATGTVLRAEPTGNEVNDVPEIKITFQCPSGDGRLHEVCNETHLHQTVRAGLQLPVLYDPGREADAILLLTLPAAVRRCLQSR